MVNLNDFAVEIAKKEGGKVNLSIAQIKEVMKLTFEKLAELTTEEVTEILDNYRKF